LNPKELHLLISYKYDPMMQHDSHEFLMHILG